MATPGYPQMGQMPPGMGGPPMGGPPGGAVQPPRPMKRGVSKAVPVVVSAGLAVGVFCGLLFGVGTGKKEAAAAPSKGTNAAKTTKEDTMATTPVVQTPKTVPTAKATGSNAVAQTGSAAGSAAAMAGSAAIAPKTTKVVIKVKPDAAASVAKIQIDGKDIEGSSIDVPADKKSVKIAVTAAGFHSFEPKSYDVAGDDMTIEIELTKRGGGGASPGFGGADTHKPSVPKAPPGGDTGTKPTKPKKPAGGLIDI